MDKFNKIGRIQIYAQLSFRTHRRAYESCSSELLHHKISCGFRTKILFNNAGIATHIARE